MAIGGIFTQDQDLIIYLSKVKIKHHTVYYTIPIMTDTIYRILIPEPDETAHVSIKHIFKGYYMCRCSYLTFLFNIRYSYILYACSIFAIRDFLEIGIELKFSF